MVVECCWLTRHNTPDGRWNAVEQRTGGQARKRRMGLEPPEWELSCSALRTKGFVRIWPSLSPSTTGNERGAPSNKESEAGSSNARGGPQANRANAIWFWEYARFFAVQCFMKNRLELSGLAFPGSIAVAILLTTGCPAQRSAQQAG